MKTESTVMYVLRLALTLLAITAFVAAALAGVNSITAPAIAELNAQKTQEAVQAVLPGGGDPIEVAAGSGTVSEAYKGENGYAVKVAPVGFDNAITMMVGIGNDGTVLGISVISQSETAGLGAVCAATTSAGEAFRAQFVGTSGTVTVSKDGGQIDAITSATITSRAVCAGVTEALAYAANLG